MENIKNIFGKVLHTKKENETMSQFILRVRADLR